MLASAIKRESAAHTRVPRPPQISSPHPPTPPSVHHRAAGGPPCPQSGFPLALYFTCNSACMSALFSDCPTLSFAHWVQTPFSVAALFTRARAWKQPRHPSADEWIKKLHIYTKLLIPNGILFIHKKEHVWVHSSEVDESRACYIEWNKSEREKQILYSNAYRI